MKTRTIFFFLMFAMLQTQAQDYLVSFAASGDTGIVTTVTVNNLTSGTSLTLNGGDILHLVKALGVDTPASDRDRMQIYPNPMAGQAELTFTAPEHGNAVLSIVDLAGRTVYESGSMLSAGRHSFLISGIKRGMYVVKITGRNYSYSSKLVSEGGGQDDARILNTPSANNSLGISVKSAAVVINMPYTEGDRLMFNGIAGPYGTVVTNVPTGNKTITFVFAGCTDGDGNHYATVQIGAEKSVVQTWMARNLAYLPTVSPSTVNSFDTPVYYVHGYQGTNVEAAKTNPNYSTYGVLYNWPAALTACPQGWHLPSDAEWTTLTDFLGLAAGGMMKETGTTHWVSPNTGATNESGFTALPAGARDDMNNFGSLGGYIWLWSSSPREPSAAWYRYIPYNENVVYRTYCYRSYGFSVRCVKD